MAMKYAAAEQAVKDALQAHGGDMLANDLIGYLDRNSAAGAWDFWPQMSAAKVIETWLDVPDGTVKPVLHVRLVTQGGQ